MTKSFGRAVERVCRLLILVEIAVDICWVIPKPVCDGCQEAEESERSHDRALTPERADRGSTTQLYMVLGVRGAREERWRRKAGIGQAPGTK